MRIFKPCRNNSHKQFFFQSIIENNPYFTHISFVTNQAFDIIGNGHLFVQSSHKLLIFAGCQCDKDSFCPSNITVVKQWRIKSRFDGQFSTIFTGSNRRTHYRSTRALQHFLYIHKIRIDASVNGNNLCNTFYSIRKYVICVFIST